MSANFHSSLFHSFYISNTPSLIASSMKIIVFGIIVSSTYSGSKLFTTFFSGNNDSTGAEFGWKSRNYPIADRSSDSSMPQYDSSLPTHSFRKPVNQFHKAKRMSIFIKEKGNFKAIRKIALSLASIGWKIFKLRWIFRGPTVRTNFLTGPYNRSSFTLFKLNICITDFGILIWYGIVKVSWKKRQIEFCNFRQSGYTPSNGISEIMDANSISFCEHFSFTPVRTSSFLSDWIGWKSYIIVTFRVSYWRIENSWFFKRKI